MTETMLEKVGHAARAVAAGYRGGVIVSLTRDGWVVYWTDKPSSEDHDERVQIAGPYHSQRVANKFAESHFARHIGRAAMEALMEPSPAMLDAGRAELAAFGVSADPGDVFRAMLRAALDEAEK